MKYSYKRGSSRVLASKNKNLTELQCIYSWRMLRTLKRNEILINIDESSFSRSVKWNYGWLPKGWSAPILNTRWVGRISIIFALISEGSWLCMSVNDTTKSIDYWIFLMLLSNFIKIRIAQCETPVKLMVDNASIHLSTPSKRTATFYNFEIHSLPPYSPNLSPVEMVFGISKKIIAKSIRSKVIDFGKPSGKKAIINSFMGLDKCTVLKLWKKFIKEAKACIYENLWEYNEKKMIRR